MKAPFCALPLLAALSSATPGADGLVTQQNLPRNVIPADGYSVSLAVPATLVERPVEACFDDRGRLYVTEVSGTNDKPEVQLKTAPHRVLRLEDTNNDGVFDTRTVFAEKLGFPEGILWHQGVVYVSVVPQILKFTDADDDGKSDTREVWFDGGTITGCANDLHGPYAGPDGLIYWCKGAFAEQTHDLPGQTGWKSRASHVFRMKPDGSQFDCVFTAGMDNPVGLAWLPEGDMIVSGTFFQHPGDGRRDGLIHAVHGGVWGKDHNVLNGHTRTGPLMPPMTHLGPAAPCGLCRYGSDLLLCQFNLRKVSRHVLTPSGSTWQTADSDFLSCEDPDFHPTDVLQAPDGSVLVVDTGGWYKICCPTSQVARPEITGSIYRMKRTAGELPVSCPAPRWKLNTADSASITPDAGIPRPSTLAARLEPMARTAASSNLHLRRQAVEALGKWPAQNATTAEDRMAASQAVTKPLLAAAALPGNDRFLEHAIIYALIEGGDPQEAVTAMRNSQPALQRACIYWLCQTNPALAQPYEVAALLASPDNGVREAVVFGLAKVPSWRAAAATWLKSQLTTERDAGLLREAVMAVVVQESLLAETGTWLESARPGPMQQMLLEIMAQTAASQGPRPEWTGPLLALTEGPDATAARFAAGVLATGKWKLSESVRTRLSTLAGDPARSPALRIPLLQALSPTTPDDAAFSMLLASVSAHSPEAVTAAQVLSRATLTTAQLQRLSTVLPSAGMLHRPLLLRAFAQSGDETLGLELVRNLEECGGLATLSQLDQRECFGRFPQPVQQALAAARGRTQTTSAQQDARVSELEKNLPAGDAIRGKVVFQSAKASCVLCHQAGYFGKHIGPDLSKIGSIRTRRDLLEAIAFPSASFVRSYEPVEVKRKDGTVAYGIIKDQSARGVTLVTGAVTPDATVPAADIAAMNPGTASLMPQGIDLILSPQELADLVAFLQSLR